MKGKSIILPGGSGGLGSAVAEALAERGAIPVIGCKSNLERAEKLAQKLRAPLVVGDILEESVRRRLFDEAQNAGEVYGLVPLVGHPARFPIETATETELLDSFRTNFLGPILVARDFAAVVGDRDASIVFVSTMQAIGVFPGSTAYAAPKAALVHTAKILAKQWSIRVNVVAPGVNNAGMAEQSVRSGKYNSFLEEKIIPRWGSPRDVVRAIMFFLEPDNYVTGQVLVVDGGLSLKM
jgi:NAD(P)-dependent dehydrogenase (short-subunit alcohol dehydrogenase family)